jgi:hypothetical protein
MTTFDDIFKQELSKLSAYLTMSIFVEGLTTPLRAIAKEMDLQGYGSLLILLRMPRNLCSVLQSYRFPA